MARLERALWVCVLSLVLAGGSAACQGKIDGSDEGDPAKRSRGGSAGDGGDEGAGEGAGGDKDDGAGGDGGGGAGSNGDDSTMPSQACLGAVFQSSAAPLRRLSSREYANTVQALLPGVTLPSFELVPDVRQDGFDNAAGGQAASPLAVEQYERAARTAASAALGDLATWAPCSANTAACAHEVLDTFAAGAYRRPLTAEESDTLTKFVDVALADNTALETMQMGIEALLQSPYFLYRPEFGSGEEVGSGAVALTGYEMASRLSYFFVASMPDAELMAAAERGELEIEAGIRAQAERLMGDPRARTVLADFFAQWLGLYKLEALSLDPNAFPEFDEALRADLYDSAMLYVERAMWQDDSFSSLMSGSYGYVNDRLAPIFGVPAPGSDDLVYVELDQAERRGVLTQPGMLASTSHGIRHSPILRGVAMLGSILCAAPPAPPPGVLAMAEDLEVDQDAICTTRDDVSMKHTGRDECRGCHASIDGAGFTFENFDALGRYRSKENGCAVDTSGSFPGTDIEGEVASAIEVAEQLATSATVTDCFSQHMFRFALGRRESSKDRCEIEAVAAQLRGSDSMQQLIVELVLTPSFRSRPAVP